MLEKIISIKNVGRFANYAAAGDVTLRKLTLIYAENGRGKTTLSAILRSLSDNDPNPVLARKTLGDVATGEPEMHLRVGGHDARFRDGSWIGSLPGARIFDSEFVHENVFAGSYVDHEHKKRHYQFVVGERGKSLADSVVSLDGETRRLSSAISDKSDGIQPHVTGTMTVEQFVELAPVENIDEIMAAQERTCESLAKARDIAQKGLLSEITLPQFDLANVRSFLSRRLADIAEEAERKTRGQLAACMDGDGEAWVRRGLGYVVDETCPFCTQPLDGVDLIAAYRAFFSEAYDRFKTDLVTVSQSILHPFSEADLLRVQRAITSNSALADFWRQHVNAADMPEMDFDAIREKWVELRNALDEQFSQKVTSPLEAILVGEPLSQASANYDNLLATMAAYDAAVAAANVAIDRKKEETAAGDLTAARQELNRLRNAKARYSSDVATMCREYELLVAAKQLREAEKERAKEDLDAYTDSTFSEYQEAINAHLREFGAGFQIVNVGRRYAGGSPSSTYQIEINSVPVDVGDDTTPPEAPCFKTTLSDGDRSTLAFAFFLARLNQDEDIDSRVVIFDDPISSLDGHRRTRTQQQIARICQRAGQVVVMSHDPYFLRNVWASADQAETKTLHITRTGDESAIAEWDIEGATQAEYFRHHRSLVEYLEGRHRGDLLPIAQQIRPLLEGNLRLRFPDDFAPNDWLGNFLEKIRNAGPGTRLHGMHPYLKELSDVNDFSKKYHHDQNPGFALEQINDAELCVFVRQALDLLCGI